MLDLDPLSSFWYSLCTLGDLVWNVTQGWWWGSFSTGSGLFFPIHVNSELQMLSRYMTLSTLLCFSVLCKWNGDQVWWPWPDCGSGSIHCCENLKSKGTKEHTYQFLTETVRIAQKLLPEADSQRKELKLKESFIQIWNLNLSTPRVKIYQIFFWVSASSENLFWKFPIFKLNESSHWTPVTAIQCSIVWRVRVIAYPFNSRSQKELKFQGHVTCAWRLCLRRKNVK